ncbi:SDR family oxidoreductase [Streptomyces sp. M19]
MVAALAERGGRVLATDLEMGPERQEALTAKYGDRVRVRALDVTDAAAVEALVAETECTLGPLDIVVNVAGVLRGAEVVRLTDEDWAATFAVNASGVFHVSRSAARRMAERGGAASSPSRRTRRGALAGMSAYAASKAAAVMFTKCLGLEMAGRGVRCNTVSPGSTLTDMQRSCGRRPAPMTSRPPRGASWKGTWRRTGPAYRSAG